MKRYKKKLNFSYSIGVYPTLELLTNHPEKVDKILVSRHGEKNRGLEKIKNICQEKKIRTEETDELIVKIANSGGCYAVGIFNKYTSVLKPGNHLVLDRPGDMGNLGTIVRTMIAYDVNNLAIIRPAADIFDPKVIRAAMGAVFKINFEYFNSFKEYRSRFNNNIYTFFTDTNNLLNKVNFQTPYSLVFGNEGSGLSDEYLKEGVSVRIPQESSVDSLNLSIAVGIALYASSLG